MPHTEETFNSLPGSRPFDVMPNRTFGSSPNLEYAPIASQTTALDEALIAARDLPSGSQREQVAKIVDLLRQSLLRWTAIDSPMPLSLHSSVLPDGALIIQWATPQFRLGFNLEENEEDSSWVLVTAPELGGNVSSGSLRDDEIRNIVFGMTRFVAENS